jgi:hypothetical protein
LSGVSYMDLQELQAVCHERAYNKYNHVRNILSTKHRTRQELTINVNSLTENVRVTKNVIHLKSQVLEK